MSDDAIPRNRWELAGEGESRYARCFEGLIEEGQDVDGEARLGDVLVPRNARVLDAGAGLGRVAGAMAARGHDVTAVEKDPDLIERSHRLFPQVPVVEVDILALTPALLAEAGRPSAYDLVMVVGNVMIYLAEDTEVQALRTLGALLAPGGRILVGFDPHAGPAHSHTYPVGQFRDDVAVAGLVVVHEFGTFELGPPSDDFVVAVLAPADT